MPTHKIPDSGAHILPKRIPPFPINFQDEKQSYYDRRVNASVWRTPLGEIKLIDSSQEALIGGDDWTFLGHTVLVLK